MVSDLDTLLERITPVVREVFHALRALQLADGALLTDPAGIVEGTGKRIRHV